MKTVAVKFQGKIVPVYVSNITPEEKAVKALDFDRKIRNDYCKALNLPSSKHVCSYMYQGCVFAWETLDNDVKMDQKFALTLNLPALKALVA